jgi:elongation factor G
LAFRLAAQGAFKEAFPKGRPVVLEPVMKVDIVAPLEFQGGSRHALSRYESSITELRCLTGAVIGGINQRKGTIADTEIRDEEFTLTAEVSLNDMFGCMFSLLSHFSNLTDPFFALQTHLSFAE